MAMTFYRSFSLHIFRVFNQIKVFVDKYSIKNKIFFLKNFSMVLADKLVLRVSKADITAFPNISLLKGGSWTDN